MGKLLIESGIVYIGVLMLASMLLAVIGAFLTKKLSE